MFNKYFVGLGVHLSLTIPQINNPPEHYVDDITAWSSNGRSVYNFTEIKRVRRFVTFIKVITIWTKCLDSSLVKIIKIAAAQIEPFLNVILNQ